MFCPKCSQPQASDNMRFCSRCGLPLALVADLLAHDGALISPSQDREAVVLSPRQRGVRQGTALLFVSLIVGFLTAVLSVFVLGSPELFVTVTAGVLFLSGMLRIIYAYMFEPGAEGGRHPSVSNQLGRSARDYALPPAQSIPVGSLKTPRVQTAEMAGRPSVTEHTTKLLEKE